MKTIARKNPPRSTHRPPAARRKTGRHRAARPHASRVLKWGNSAAVLLPRFVTESANLRIGTEITFAMQNGGVLLRPTRRRPTVHELLEGVTPQKVERIDWGRAVGKEAIR